MPFQLTTKKRNEDSRIAARVFQRIEMHNGDRTKCWPWKGFVRGQPITRINGQLFAVNRIVYGLKTGIPYHMVPKLEWLCDDVSCCNPDHIVPSKERKKYDQR